MKTKTAIFLDRDNTLTVDKGYTSDPKDFAWIEGAPEALKLFNDLSLPVFVVTNQGGIGRGFFTEKEMGNFNKKLTEEAKKVGGFIRDIAFCPHHPLSKIETYRKPCSCRKPKPGMLISLAKKWDIDLSNSLLIGDRETDIHAGLSVGCFSSLLKTGDSLLLNARRALVESRIKSPTESMRFL